MSLDTGKSCIILRALVVYINQADNSMQLIVIEILIREKSKDRSCICTRFKATKKNITQAMGYVHTFDVNQSCAGQVRYVAVLVVLLLITYLILPTRHYEPDSTSVMFVHLLSFAFHFGAQFWVTFVAGITMFLNLPRIMFGQIQSKLFPMYFACSLILSSITLATYTARHPYDTWTDTESRQIKVLTICVISTFLNTTFMAPKIVSAMVNVFELEKESGTAYVIGYADRTELVKDPKYNKYYRMFRICHGISGIANMVTLVCNTLYLYHLACLCVYLNIENQYCEGS